MKIQKFIVSKSNLHQSSDDTVEFFNIRQNYIVPVSNQTLFSLLGKDLLVSEYRII